MSGIIIAIIVVTILFAVALVFILKIVKDKTKDTIKEEEMVAENTSEFMPFDDIEHSMIVCSNHVYKAVIECSSVNLGLMSLAELDRVQDSYYRLMDSINFPFSIYIITKEIDNEKMRKKFEELSEDPLMKFPSLTHYHEDYLEELKNLPRVCNNSKQKKKYIVITYEDAGSMDKLTDDEKFTQSAKELGNRCNIFIDGLSRVGISAKILNSDEIADLLYSVYHKESLSSVGNIIDGDYDSLVVEGENGLQGADAYQFMDLILAEAINELNESVLNNNEINEYEKLQTKDCIDDLMKLRKEHSGYYQTKAVVVDGEDGRYE